jgi:hypothetical protein
MEQFPGWLFFYCSEMKTRNLTAKQLSSIPCPTCGVAAGHSCVLYSGAPRFAPHVDRRFSAIAAIERKQIRAHTDFDNSARHE